MQRIDVLGLQAFVGIAEEGSFRGAAERLNLSATAVTRRLQKLEDTLGVILISRTTRQITLTKVGQDYLPEAQRLLATLEESLDGLRSKGRFASRLHRREEVTCSRQIRPFRPGIFHVLNRPRFLDQRMVEFSGLSQGSGLAALP
ncbi:LysR family transcriptional regulator [Agrobacterium tumefaciens]|uniref:LysR family transcriptional regulator n=1 Tax=Agrobacterium tumefaciens TaxID=358 RepID=UPI002243899C|nr:LysR family transcriptional regulator [Agrobacterium tumefaciens]MCW8061198.1 LysR family transcriptional regulator [Agrobacterium tumefaciens]MCW8146049.1 LysR family transcriptional regulator [Agrobacterium tumefaciens]